MQGCTAGARRITCAHHVSHKQTQQQQPARRPLPLSRRQALHGVLLGGALLTVVPQRPALADGLESVELPPLPSTPKFIDDLNKQNQAALDAAEESFQNSELLKTLRERSEANRSRNKRELEDKYCRRQAELGVGDCGGLRLIPGMTKSGVQKRPEWMEKMLGKQE